MQTIQRWWRTTFGKVFLILTGGLSSAVFCCVGLLVLVAVVNPPAPAARSAAAARTAVLQQVADTTGDAARAPLPTILPSAVSTAPPASATPQPTNTAQPTAAPTSAPTATPTVAPPSPTPVPQVQITQAVNMRAGPSSAFAVKQTVQPGTSATLLSVRNEDGTAWYEVRANGTTGWMSGTVVDMAPEQAAALPVNTVRFVPPTPVPAPQPAAQPAAPAPSGGRVGAICRDGARSTATGRGACSHHGGVAQWLYR